MSTVNPQSIEDLAPSTREWLARLSAWTTRAISWVNPNRLVWAEWLILLVVGYLYSSATLLNFDPNRLQQSGEHPESSTLPILAEIGLRRYGEIPLWNPYMLAGFPHQGDLINHFWNPVATIPVWLFGGVVGMKVSIFLSFVIAGFGQWTMSHIFGLRGWVRLWSAVLFMLAGGLALLWRLGWYELLVGMVWYPWFFAALWWALHRRDRVSLVLTGATIYMILTTGGGYYPLYLAVTGGVLTVMAMLFAPVGETFRVLRRAVVIGLIGVLLSAVAMVPWWDGLRYTARDAVPDWNQEGAQPIHYALMNYAISKIDWFGTSMLGTKGGWNWFYIGWLPLVVLVLTPLAYIDSRNRQKKNILAIFVLTLAILAWFANPFTPVKLIYDLFPTLYQFRFPNRLLILASSPLLVLGGYGLQYLFAEVWRTTKAWGQRLPTNARDLAPLVSAFGVGTLVLMVFFTLRGSCWRSQAPGRWPSEC